MIEILVAMAIVALIVGVATTGLRSVFNINMKKSASQLASTLRYLSNRAVTNHRYIRVLYDLESQSYSVEECTEPIVISLEDEETEAKAAEEAAEGEEAQEGEGTQEEAEEGETKKQAADSSCGPPDSSLLKPVKLPSGVFFKDVMVSYLPDKREQGKVTTYFFPDGYATPTLINFRDEDDENHFSVEVEALSGKVKVASEYREALAGAENEK